MQPDFYHSLINLGRTYLARGPDQDRPGHPGEGARPGRRQRASRRASTARSSRTYLVNGLVDELARVTAQLHRALPRRPHLRLLPGHAAWPTRARCSEGQAVMDSCLAAWRSKEFYGKSSESRQSIDYADPPVRRPGGRRRRRPRHRRPPLAPGGGAASTAETALPRDLVTTATAWRRPCRPSGRPRRGPGRDRPMLAVNPRAINVLVLARSSATWTWARTADARRAVDQLHLEPGQGRRRLPGPRDGGAARTPGGRARGRP